MSLASFPMGRDIIEFLRPGVAAYRRLKQAVTRRAGYGLFDRRAKLAARYLKGEGIEVGALHEPLRVARGVRVRYVDHISREESLNRFPELDREKIVHVDYVGDGLVLEPIADASQDFLIANHVLEHSPNPIQGLRNWSRVLRKDGVLFFAVPLAKRCFDRGRPITDLAHFIEDDRLYEKGDQAALRARNRVHYQEWRNISERNMCLDEGRPFPIGTPEAEEKRLAAVLDQACEIHFHTFSIGSLRALLKHYTRRIDPSLRLIRIVENENEAVALLRKVR